MKPINLIRKIALSFPETTEQPHFEKTSFRVKQKIFATCDSAGEQLCIKLSEIEQSVYCTINSKAIYPVPNKWGKQGWTILLPANLATDIIKDALCDAYCAVAPPKLVQSIRSKS